MKTLITMSGILLLGTALAVGQNANGAPGQASANSSPNNAQGQSAYGNNTYNTGAHPPAAENGAPAAVSNAALQGRIQDALRNEPTLGSSHVQTNVTASTIELTGTVGSTQDKQTAERIAQSFDGNRKLDDKLVVTGHGHSDMSPDHSAINNGGTGNAPNPSLPSGSSTPQQK